MQWMKFRRRNNFRQLLHINRFYVDNISLSAHIHQGSGGITKRLIWNIQVPQINPQIVGGYKRFGIGIDTNGINVVGVRVLKDPSRRGGHDSFVVCHSGQT